ncbi:hypothetical protein ONZ45_g16317 [Pleurotus djamor]|nr:hypothetical protein ONZ45_g16317 [Pleurotus djamor]
MQLFFIAAALPWLAVASPTEQAVPSVLADVPPRDSDGATLDKFAPDILPRLVAIADLNTYEIDCTVFPNVCQNWCFYRYCKTTGGKTGDNRYIVTVNSTASLRGESECRGKNRCSTRTGLRDKWDPNPTAGQSCDEQPKNTNNEGGAGAATRCMPAGENSKEGAVWGGYIKSKKLVDGDLVTISLMHKPTTGYCAASPSCTHSKSPGTGDSVRQL